MASKNQTLKRNRRKHGGENSPVAPHLPTRHFYSWFVWSWHWEWAANLECWAPFLGRMQLQSQLSGQVWAGIGGNSRSGHAQPRVIVYPANLRGRNAPSNWMQHLSARPGEADGGEKVSPHMEKEVKERELSSNQAAPPGSMLLTWWTDYLFTPSMNMKRPSRFNPALLSLSTRPIVAQIFVAGSRGWAERRARMNILIL